MSDINPPSSSNDDNNQRVRKTVGIYDRPNNGPNLSTLLPIIILVLAIIIIAAFFLIPR